MNDTLAKPTGLRLMFARLLLRLDLHLARASIGRTSTGLLAEQRCVDDLHRQRGAALDPGRLAAIDSRISYHRSLQLAWKTQLAIEQRQFDKLRNELAELL